MRDNFFALPGIETGEKSTVSMLLTQSVFLGIFFGAFDITAHSLFFSVFDEKMMARGYVVSGLAGLIIISLFSWSQTKMQFRNIAVVNLFIVTALTIFAWSLLILAPAKLMIFIVFVMLGPLNIVALLGFWGTADRLFNFRHGKRIFRFIDAGLIIGVIIVSIAIPVLLSFKFKLNYIFLLAASSVFVATIIQLRIGKQIGPIDMNVEKIPEKKDSGKSLFAFFRKDPYFRNIGIFVALSVAALFFVQYLFMAVTKEQYPVAENMARFLGIFTASTMILTLFVKLVVFNRALHNYGLRTCLIVSPIIVAVITALSILFGLLIGYTPPSTIGFLIFFVLLVLSRLFSKSLRDSVDFPLLKVIFHSIEKGAKPGPRSETIGTISEIATLSSGVILTLMGLFSFIKLIHFSLVLFLITIILVFVALRVYTEYKKAIRNEAEKEDDSRSGNVNSDVHEILNGRFASYMHFRTDYFNLISGDYSVADKIKNKWYFEKLIDQAHSKKDINLLPVLKKAAINSGLEEIIRQYSIEVVEILEKHSTSSTTEVDKIDGANKILAGTRRPQTTLILRLLRDNSIESKKLAIYMIGKFKLSDLLSEVCGCLNIHGLEIDAYSVLRSFGKDAEDELFRLYLVTSGDARTSKTILRLLGETCSKESVGFLFSRLKSNSRRIKEIAVEYLIACGFKPSKEDKDLLNQLTSEVIGLITWNLSAKICLIKSNDNFLLEEVNKEIERWEKFLFNVLSITYNSDAVARIRENLHNDTVESVNYALEIIDVIVDDSVKPKLVSLLGAAVDEDKLKNLYNFYPAEIPGYTKLQEDIINRDYNLLSLWTKACTLRKISRIKGIEMAESVTALLFSPEGIIQEEAANLIARSNPELFRSTSQRIPESSRKRLDKIIFGPADKEELLFEKVLFLSECFGVIPEDDLLFLAGAMKYQKVLDPESVLLLNESCIIWTLSGEKTDNEVRILNNDKIDRLNLNYQSRDNLSYYVLPLTAIEDYNFQFPEKSSEILKYIENHEE
jgi:AAA family ATP:ADP antiporter